MESVLKHVTDYTINASRGIGSARSISEAPTAVVVLNYRLPRFTPLLWSQGEELIFFIIINLLIFVKLLDMSVLYF